MLRHNFEKNEGKFDNNAEQDSKQSSQIHQLIYKQRTNTTLLHPLPLQSSHLFTPSHSRPQDPLLCFLSFFRFRDFKIILFQSKLKARKGGRYSSNVEGTRKKEDNLRLLAGARKFIGGFCHAPARPDGKRGRSSNISCTGECHLHRLHSRTATTPLRLSVAPRTAPRIVRLEERE